MGGEGEGDLALVSSNSWRRQRLSGLQKSVVVSEGGVKKRIEGGGGGGGSNLTRPWEHVPCRLRRLDWAWPQLESFLTNTNLLLVRRLKYFAC
jgi:hypothetical protein